MRHGSDLMISAPPAYRLFVRCKLVPQFLKCRRLPFRPDIFYSGGMQPVRPQNSLMKDMPAHIRLINRISDIRQHRCIHQRHFAFPPGKILLTRCHIPGSICAHFMLFTDSCRIFFFIHRVSALPSFLDVRKRRIPLLSEVLFSQRLPSA